MASKSQDFKIFLGMITFGDLDLDNRLVTRVSSGRRQQNEHYREQELYCFFHDVFPEVERRFLSILQPDVYTR